ncbi:metal-dependent hydrolase [Brevibacillus fluminis]|uniref:metal-dependent hydrolase n=1 Tax=Brevibacillus fluminis TaxID=511487 RepID=UPI003F8954AC
MDTGSHLLLGVSLAGLAYADPVVALHPEIAHAVMIGTMIGSVAPDFDTVVRLRGYAFYIRHHRGISHSIPALFLWPAVISGAIMLCSGLSHGWLSLFLWTLAAVMLHVGLDMCNTYGVQSLRPFSKAWVHLDILSIFEPFLFFLHLAGVVAWWLHASIAPGMLFGLIYAISGLYIVIRARQHRALIRLIKAHSGQKGLCHVFPQLSWFRWQYLLEGEQAFYTGMIERGRIMSGEVFSKQEKNDVIQATVGTDGVRAFLAFAQRVHVTCLELHDGYHVRWSDVRFWHGQKLPFGVDVRLDRELNVISCSLGWRKKVWEPPFV